MNKLGITKGVCCIVNYAGYINLQSGEFYGDEDLLNESECEEAEENAELFKDAFNTAQKCGLLPSELLEQRDKLINHLNAVNDVLKNMREDYYNHDLVKHTSDLLVEMNDKAIKKATS